MKPPIDNGNIVITGASSGIGREFAVQLAHRARRIVLVARRRDRLDALAGELRAANASLAVEVRDVDLTDKAALAALADELCGPLGPVDVLVNNAGMGEFGCFDMSKWDKQEFLIDLNVRSLLYLTHRLVPGMVERGRGGILNIGSSYGLTYTPGFATYIGTKYFVNGFTETLRTDLAGTGVVVTQICSGPIRTEFMDNVGNFTGYDVPGFVSITAEKCARQSLHAFECGRARYTPGFVIWFVLLLASFTPTAVLRVLYGPISKTMRKVQRRKIDEGNQAT